MGCLDDYRRSCKPRPRFARRRTKIGHSFDDSIDNTVQDEDSREASDDDRYQYFRLEQEQSMEDFIRGGLQESSSIHKGLEDDLDVDDNRDGLRAATWTFSIVVCMSFSNTNLAWGKEHQTMTFRPGIASV